MRLYVSNLPYSVTSATLRDAFSKYGCTAADIIRDKVTGRPRGYAFVEVANVPQDTITMGGRHLRVSEATPNKVCSNS